MEDRAAVLDFVRQHDLHDLLLQAREPLNVAFGAKATKVLRLVHDPEDGYTNLFCLILTSWDADTALEARWAFERNWWNARCGTAQGWLNFDVEFV